MHTLEIKIPPIPQRNCKIIIGTDILSVVLNDVEKLFPSHKPYIITDSNVSSSGHLEKLVGGKNIQNYTISPAGEPSKNMTTIVEILETMEKIMLGRNTVILALGGGTVGDTAGFAAAIFKRGVPIVQIPTTTVAQADSAIGGKTGVNSSISKNAFGAFWQPSAVYIDTSVLKTLDKRQFCAGLVESVKHALIADKSYFEYLEKNLDAILAQKADTLEEIAVRNCKIKAAVVEADPFEQNQRQILNYGHTIGHAVESASNYMLLHGEALAIGIIASGLIEQQLELAKKERLERIKNIFAKLGVAMQMPPSVKKDDLLALLKYDKKAVNKCPRFVLLEDIGKVHIKNGTYTVEVEKRHLENVIDLLL